MVRRYTRTTERGSYGTERLTAALAAVKGGMPLKTAAKEFGIPPRSLRRHRDNKVSQPGTVTMGKTKSALPDYIERELHDHIQFMEKRLYGLTTSDVRKLAFEIAEKANIENPFNKASRMAGKDWLRGFFARHHDLTLREPQGTSVARAVGFNRPKVKEFFTAYKEILNTISPVRPSNIWNMDETGISNVQKPAKIIATKGCRQVGKMTSAERGINVTVICAMSAAGVHLPPMFIFPRKRMVDTLMNGAPPQSVGFCSPKGWTDSDLFLKWLEHFVQFTNSSTQASQIVILDGHHSHKSLKAILYAREHGVHLITLPPHSTHKLQPLDRTYFKSLKLAYNGQADSWMISNPGKRISSYEMAGIFAKAFLKTATPEKAVRGFETCGLWPYNEHIFSDNDFCAAEVTEENQPIDHRSNETSQPNGPPVVINITQPTQHPNDMNISNELTQSNGPAVGMNITQPNQPPNDMIMSNEPPQPNQPLNDMNISNETPQPNQTPNDMSMSNEPPQPNKPPNDMNIFNEPAQPNQPQNDINMSKEPPQPNQPLNDLNMSKETTQPNQPPNDMSMSNETPQPKQPPNDINMSYEPSQINKPPNDININNEPPQPNQYPNDMNINNEPPQTNQTPNGINASNEPSQPNQTPFNIERSDDTYQPNETSCLNNTTIVPSQQLSTVVPHDLKVIVTNGDGRCLFRSLVIGMDAKLQTVKRDANGHAIDAQLKSLEEAKSDSLRKSMVGYMNDNIQSYSRLEINAINADSPSWLRFTSIEDRIRAMADPKTMPGELELIATSNVLKKRVIILDQEKRVLADYRVDNFQDSQPLFVEFKSVGSDVGHYNCLVSPEIRHMSASESSINIKGIIHKLSPPPKLSETRSRKRKAESATILTSSPFKKSLEDKQDAKSTNQGRWLKTKGKYTKQNQNKKSLSITKQKSQSQVKKNSNKKGKRKGKENYKSTYSSDENEEWPCIICCEPFSSSNDGEEWVQCQICLKWAHDECTPGYVTFVCPNCESDED